MGEKTAKGRQEEGSPRLFERPALTVPELLLCGAPDAPALLAPDRKEMTFREMREQIYALAQYLASLGLAKERIAIVMDNSPDLVLSLLAATFCGTAVPLNPKYRTAEFSFFYENASVKGLIALPGTFPEAIEAAPPGTVVVNAVTDPSGGLRFGSTHTGRSGGNLKIPLPHDVAILMYTSGTTKSPKSVPIRHRNVAASAINIVQAYNLTPVDRSLCVMPLFHIHGIVASLLGPLAAGGSVVVPPGFDARTFWGVVENSHPTWYSAVPTMHQMLLARADRHAEIICKKPFRFIRSCSSPLPPTVKKKMVEVFGSAVTEAYGMTETAHQIASNPLPPGIRKPGAVGLGIGVEVAIMDEEGELLPAGVQGEVVARGFNVMDGYESNPEANKDVFVNGWLRTGDQGVMDEDNYLTITGRISERINRGGEKISPSEIDYTLLDHPAVSEALAFAVPHQKLGQDVHAAVVLKEPATEQELRRYCADHLADFKVPRQIHILEALPYGKTGKPMRTAMAQILGLKE
ncbi:MAG: acyl--CoA ligase [bacterium]|nr:acyl--CoA ligase [bacterium]MDT8396525.1 acyl--CoA ligase [bacterium]